MSAMKLAGLFALTMVAFLAVDAVWLTTATPRLYRPALASLLADKPNLAAAAVFYAIYVVGVLMLAVIPGVQGGSLSEALWRGAVLGFVAYATYDLTNLATLRDWPIHITLIDLAWGTALTTATAFAGYHAALWLKITG